MIRLDATTQELAHVYEALHYLSRSPSLPDDPSVRSLRSFVERIRKVAPGIFCKVSACDRIATRHNGLCDACNAYQHKYGKLPSEEVTGRRKRTA